VACILTPSECFHKNVVARDLGLGLKQGKNGWWSMRCGVRRHGRPLRLHVGDHVHISYADLGQCPESEVFAWLVKQGLPRECLKKPKDWPALKRSRESGDTGGKLADSILDVAFGRGTSADRLVRVVVLALDAEIPEGPMCDVLARNLGLSPRTVYKATAELRRRNRTW
jgi:hypothetical protein